ncbi:MAG TPA: tyrosine-type recombinase/integrase [Caldisericia bacterium]|jgi:integrase/recombinase XerC/integrase/recombinase XerD|nr:tyrosine-type recombinase/integrase [Caldisericia bacterium]HXK51362.1 tyrosine-type recombinase/integrase [Caldisericia bacterium]
MNQINSRTKNTLAVIDHSVESRPTSPIGKSFKELKQDFLSSIDLKKSSIDVYSRQLESFIQWITAKKMTSPSRDDILQYKEYLYKKDLSALTISSYIVVVRKFFAWMESTKVYPNIARDVKGLKRNRGFRKDTLSIDQIRSVLNSIDTQTIQGKRDFAIINLLIRTGLRTIEITRANIADIRQKGGCSILWIQGKGRDTKDEFVVLTTETLKPIHDYLSCRPSSTKRERSPLFMSNSSRNNGQRLTTRSISRIVKNQLVQAGINTSRITAHSLRHTAITLALQAGATIQEAQALGRHANINTTMIYAHNINRIENAPELKIEKILDLLKSS